MSVLKKILSLRSITRSFTVIFNLQPFSFMAKTYSIITTGFQGTLGGVTFVRSRRYGKHARAARGSIKPATLNDRMKESSERMAAANIPAKLIFDALKEDHKDGTLWIRLLSIYRKQVKEGLGPDIQCLAKLECSIESSLHTIVSDYKVSSSIADGLMKVDLQLKHEPSWKKAKYLTGYQASIIALFVDMKKMEMDGSMGSGTITSFGEELKPMHFEFEIPTMAKEYLLLLKVEGAENGKVVKQPHVRGMRVVEVGRV